MTHCLGHGHFSNPTDTGTAHRSRARRVHRAPHPRASTASLNPAERSAAEIHRESHRPRAARRGVRARPLDSTAEWGAPPSPGKAEPPKRAGDVSKPNASRVRVLHIARYRRYASHGRAFTRSQVRTRRRLPGFSSCPRLASSLPNPPRGVLSSTHAAPETRVICDRFANRGPEHASLRRGTACVIRRTNDMR